MNIHSGFRLPSISVHICIVYRSVEGGFSSAQTVLSRITTFEKLSKGNDSGAENVVVVVSAKF